MARQQLVKRTHILAYNPSIVSSLMSMSVSVSSAVAGARRRTAYVLCTNNHHSACAVQALPCASRIPPFPSLCLVHECHARRGFNDCA